MNGFLLKFPYNNELEFKTMQNTIALPLQ